MKFWLKAVIWDILLATAFYRWQWGDIEGAGNVFVFVMWLQVALRLLVTVSVNAENWAARVAKEPRPAGFGGYIAASNASRVLALVWIGYIWLPAIYVVSALLYEGGYQKAAEQKGGAT